MPEQCAVAVVGGGVTGLSAAHYLAEKFGPDHVLLLDAGDQIGGQTRTTHTSGFSCDWGPNGFLDREPLTLRWIEDLGIAGEMVRANAAAAHRFILKAGRLVEVPLSPPKFLTSPLLSPGGRARVLMEPLIRRRVSREPESLWHFAARRIGRQAADMMVDPMASGIFGGDSKQLSLAHCFPKMADMEAEYGSLFKAMLAKKREKKSVSAAGPAGTLTSFARGIGYLPEVAAQRLGGRVLRNTRAVDLERGHGAYRIRTDAGPDVEARGVVLALPAYAAASLCARLDGELSAALADIPYANIVVLCTGYRRDQVGHDLNGFGFVVPRNQKRRVLGCIWTSSIFPDRAPEGQIQLRTMYGGYTDPDILELTDKELLGWLKREVEDLMRISGGPEFVQIYRWPRGIPQFTLEHGRRLAAIEAGEARHPGLVFAGNAYRGVGLNDCVVSAHRAVAKLASLPAVAAD